MRSSFRLLVAASIRVWPVPAVPPVFDTKTYSFGETDAAVSPAHDPHREVARLCPVPAVPAVPNTRTTSQLGCTHVNGRVNPAAGRAARWA